MADYRIHYGNGQVHPVKSKAEGIRELRQCDPRATLQKYEAGSADDPGDWFVIAVRGTNHMVIGLEE